MMMLKKIFWAVPVLGIGMAIGGLTLPNVFATSSTPQINMPPAQSQQMMQQALNTPQGQAMIQTCNNFMGQYAQAGNK